MLRVLLSKTFNIIAFNLTWLACVVGRDDYLWLAAPAVFVYVILLVRHQVIELKRLLPLIAIGISIDVLLTALGIFQFEASLFGAGGLLIPAWLMVLWVAFSTTLFLSLRMIGRYKILAALCGALVIPFNYAVGERLGAVSFGDAYPLALLSMSAIWIIALPLSCMIADGKLEKFNVTT
mgnify:FL=1